LQCRKNCSFITSLRTEKAVKYPNVEKHAKGLEQFFDVHEFKVIERRIANKEEFENWKPSKVFLTED